MEFSKAIQIKQLVNDWNKTRRSEGCDSIKFECDMFRIGKWSIDIETKGGSPIYSYEMDELINLYAGGGFRMFISAFEGHPIIHLQ